MVCLKNMLSTHPMIAQRVIDADTLSTLISLLTISVELLLMVCLKSPQLLT